MVAQVVVAVVEQPLPEVGGATAAGGGGATAAGGGATGSSLSSTPLPLPS